MGTRKSYATGLGWAGLEGMRTWIARPLLTVGKVSLPIHITAMISKLITFQPKDRILATCEANDLTYSVDKTNFQPSLTPRNAIRSALTASIASVSLYPSASVHRNP